jgi:hypothetical protein
VEAVLGEIHDRHPAPAELALDQIAVGEGGAQRLEQVSHGHPLSAYRGPSVAAIGERALQAPGGDPTPLTSPSWSPLR